jgi:hypothetical protein
MPQIPSEMGIQVSKCSGLATNIPVVYSSHFYSLAGLQLHQQLLPKAVKLAALEQGWQCVSEAGLPRPKRYQYMYLL